MPARDLLRLFFPSRPADPLGARGESLAARTLRRSGYKLLGRNLRTAAGEADLFALAPDRTTLVLVEVKTRIVRRGHDTPFAAGELAVDDEKLSRLRDILRHLQRANRWLSRPARIDIIAIDWPEPTPESPRPRPSIRHHQGCRQSRNPQS